MLFSDYFHFDLLLFSWISLPQFLSIFRCLRFRLTWTRTNLTTHTHTDREKRRNISTSKEVNGARFRIRQIHMYIRTWHIENAKTITIIFIADILLFFGFFLLNWILLSICCFCCCCCNSIWLLSRRGKKATAIELKWFDWIFCFLCLSGYGVSVFVSLCVCVWKSASMI